LEVERFVVQSLREMEDAGGERGRSENRGHEQVTHAARPDDGRRERVTSGAHGGLSSNARTTNVGACNLAMVRAPTCATWRSVVEQRHLDTERIAGA